MASVYEAILGAVKTAIDGLGLVFGGAPVPVVVAKLPQIIEMRHQLPRIWVTPGGPEPQVIPGGFEGPWLVDYKVEVTLAARASGRDQHQNLETWLGFREQIRRAFEKSTLAGAATVYDVDVQPGPPLDHAAFGVDHDVSILTLLFRSAEPGGI